MIRVVLPYQLQRLAACGPEIEIALSSPVTLGLLIDGIEEKYPCLRGTIRDHDTLQRRPMLRFFACSECE